MKMGRLWRQIVSRVTIVAAMLGLTASVAAPIAVMASEALSAQANFVLPDGYKQIDGANGSWKIVPTKNYENQANAKSLDLVPESELATAIPERLQGMFNQYSAVVFGSASIKKGGANTADPRLAVGGDIQLNADSFQPLAASQPTVIGGDLYEQGNISSVRSASLGTGPIVFAPGHGITGKGKISSRLQALLNNHQVFMTNQISPQYFDHLKTAAKTMSASFGEAATKVADASSTTDSHSRRLFQVDDAHYNAGTNAYYFNVDASEFEKANGALVFSGQTHPNAKVIVNIQSENNANTELSLNGWQILKTDGFSADAKDVILNFSQATTLDTENTGNSLRAAVTIFAPNAAVTETDVFPIGTFLESNASDVNPFEPVQAKALVQYFNVDTGKQVGDSIPVSGEVGAPINPNHTLQENPDVNRYIVKNPGVLDQATFTGGNQIIVVNLSARYEQKLIASKVIRHIYQDIDGKRISLTDQEVTFDGTARIDRATNTVQEDWNKSEDHWDEYVLPAKPGYTRHIKTASSQLLHSRRQAADDVAVVPAQTVYPHSLNVNLFAEYSPVKPDPITTGTVNIQYRVDGQLVKNDVESGKVGDRVAYSPEATIADFEQQGRRLITNTFPDNATFAENAQTFVLEFETVKVPVPQTGVINVTYVAGNQILRTESQHGLVDALDGYTTAGTIATFEQQGYHLESDGYTNHGRVLFTSKPQTFVVKLEKATTPGDPSKPVEPGKPTTPEQPGKPEQPSFPAVPLEPSLPVVEEPGTGTKPEQPGSVQTPAQHPASAKNISDAHRQLPQTGNQKSGILVSLGLLVLLTVSGFAFSRWVITHKS
ncbi:mucin-binding protein [Lacticaseibacillus brantae]|uniref:Cell surface protein n=1 Tax=Lacticaseibacillus brantae DSM 23927 TaxID=1423727 RepID=A0A0R2B9T9_9LACO|nr:LPXTG cell wall anchor domain-containing protein [Lacticaseibacillus brantae]KRM72339.1 hypothetical protein FC34_GL000039 [Lacticaseibacillus brantae DSM 23927]